MRIALLGDIHGNLEALEAALAAVGEVDAHWVLGDLVAHGPRPVECLRRVAGLAGLVAVRGNTDRYVLTEPPLSVMRDSASRMPASEARRALSTVSMGRMCGTIR